MKLQFDILQAVGHAIATDAPLANLLELVADMILDAVPAEAATIFLKDEAAGELRFAVTRGEAAANLKDRRIPADAGVVGWVVSSNRYAIVPHAGADDRFDGAIDEFTGFETRSILCVPLRTRHNAIGAVELINRRAGAFRPEEAEYVTTIANQTAQLIENVQLMQERQRHSETLEALCRAANWLNSSLDRDVVLGRLVEEAEKVINTEAGSILLVDAKGRLNFVVALGPARERLMQLQGEIQAQLNRGQGIAAWVAENGAPVMIPDCSKDPRFTSGPGKAFAQKLGFETRSMLCVPMRAQDEVVGVLQLINKTTGEPFDSTDMAMLSVFADDAAAALTNARLYESVQLSYMSTINSLAVALDTRDNETGGHSQRVALFAQEVAQALGFDEDAIDAVVKGSLLHDVGKIGIPDSVLRKEGPLDEDEWKIMRQHVAIGCGLLEGVDFLRRASVVPLCHHERFDGKGYLLGLKGDAIPIGARIFAVVDTYDAITSDRPYRQARSDSEARAEIRAASGAQFDPEVADAFMSIPLERVETIRGLQSGTAARKVTAETEAAGIQKARTMLQSLRAHGVLPPDE